MGTLLTRDNQPINTNDNAILLGQTPQADTISVVPILSSTQTGMQWIHLIAAIFALLTVLSLIVPPRWINGGKGGLANFQRSGIVTLALGAITFVLMLAAFGVIYSTTVSAMHAMRDVDGIDAVWGNAMVRSHFSS